MHSPDWSHTGQSSGWFTRYISSVPSRDLSDFSLCVWITFPSITVVTHAGISFGAVSTSTRHMRHCAGALSAAW